MLSYYQMVTLSYYCIIILPYYYISYIIISYIYISNGQVQENVIISSKSVVINATSPSNTVLFCQDWLDPNSLLQVDLWTSGSNKHGCVWNLDLYIYILHNMVNHVVGIMLIDRWIKGFFMFKQTHAHIWNWVIWAPHCSMIQHFTTIFSYDQTSFPNIL